MGQSKHPASEGAEQKELRVIEILAQGVLDVLPETEERASRVLDRARELFDEKRAVGAPLPRTAVGVYIN